MSRQNTIEERLRNTLNPLHMQVVDESHMHSVPEGAQSHFKLIVVSENFANKKLLARHREINSLLKDEFSSGLHALSIHAWTPDEWYEKGGKAPESPECMGGSKAG
jgi:BolA protein